MQEYYDSEFYLVAWVMGLLMFCFFLFARDCGTNARHARGGTYMPVHSAVPAKFSIHFDPRPGANICDLKFVDV